MADLRNVLVHAAVDCVNADANASDYMDFHDDREENTRGMRNVYYDIIPPCLICLASPFDDRIYCDNDISQNTVIQAHLYINIYFD